MSANGTVLPTPVLLKAVQTLTFTRNGDLAAINLADFVTEAV